MAVILQARSQGLLQENYHHIRTGFDGHVTDMKTALTQIVSFTLMPCSCKSCLIGYHKACVITTSGYSSALSVEGVLNTESEGVQNCDADTGGGQRCMRHHALHPVCCQ